MENYILDTNFFFNLEIKSGFGESPKEIVINFTQIIQKLKAAGKADFFMPPRIRDEFLTFVSESEAWARDFLGAITIKSPHIDTVNFPSRVFYQLVEEGRERSYKGLKVAEDIADQAAQKMMGKEALSKMDYQKQIGELITKLRERHRQATRVNFLDSVADLDLIVLAHELEAFLVTSDEGVTRWGRLFGVKEIDPKDVKRRLEALG